MLTRYHVIQCICRISRLACVLISYKSVERSQELPFINAVPSANKNTNAFRSLYQGLDTAHREREIKLLRQSQVPRLQAVSHQYSSLNLEIPPRIHNYESSGYYCAHTSADATEGESFLQCFSKRHVKIWPIGT